MSKILPNIVMSKDELQAIKERTHHYMSGAEGLIIRQPNKNVVRKILLSEIVEEEYQRKKDIEAIRENKLNKIIRLGTMEGLLNELFVSATITSEDKTFIGYEMTSTDVLYPLDTNPLLKDEKLDYLKSLRRRLDNFHEHGIIYGDIKDSNILVNREKGIICFCDLDNVQIGTHEIDLMNYSIQRFADENGHIQEGADRYMFNVLTLNQLYYPFLDYRELIGKLDTIKASENAPKEVEKILKKMKKKSTYFDGGYLIDYLQK